ncbi:MAG: DinB family protein, partial [Flavobacteriaceae bacterium]
MNPEAIEKLRYPIGKFDWEAPRTKEVLNEAIVKIKNFPAQLNELVSPLSTPVLLHRYRPEGWTIAQVVHHLADSHMHSYLRFKHALL